MRNDENKEKILSFLGWALLCLILINLLYVFVPRETLINTKKQIGHFEGQEAVSNALPHLNEDTLSKPAQMIVFFASWCGMCSMEHPRIVALKKEYPDLQIHGVTVNDTPYATLHFLEQNQNPYDSLSAASMDMLTTFKVMGIPQTFLVNDKREVLFHRVGVLTQKDIDQEIIPIVEPLIVNSQQKQAP